MPRENRSLKWLIPILLLVGSAAQGQFYHGMHHPFGKNRVQHEHFEWVKYEFEYFTVYFYGESKNLAQFTAINATEMINEVEQFFDYSIKKERLQFVVYQKLEHFRQSNVGIPDADASTVGGNTQIAGSKVFVYYDGDLNSFRRQIRHGLAQVLVGQMLFGDNWREMIKNSALINFPLWFTTGLTAYAAGPWDVNADDQLRDLVGQDQFSNFNRIKDDDAEIAGRALWYYIAETYGSNVIPNILYMARVTRNIESGFLFVLGISLNTLLSEANRYFAYRYSKDEEGTQPFGKFMPIKTSKRADYTEPRLSDDGRYLAYVENNLSRTRLWVYDTQKNKRRRIMRQGHRLQRIYDLAYPVLDWNPVTKELMMVAEKNGRTWLHRFDMETGKSTKIEMLRIEKVLEMEVADNGKEIVLSAINNGQTDIYLYSVAANSARQLTNDIFDDRQPSFWLDNSILFSSNRTTDTVNVAKDYLKYPLSKTMEIYQLPLDAGKHAKAQRLTFNDAANAQSPKTLGEDSFVYLSDMSGIKNRYLAKYDSAILSVDTIISYRYFAKSEAISSYSRNVNEFDLINYGAPELAQMIKYDGRYRFQTVKGDSITRYQFMVNSNFAQDQQPKATSLVSVPEPVNIFDSLGIIYSLKKVFPDDMPADYGKEGLVDIFNYTFEGMDDDKVTDKVQPTPISKTGAKDTSIIHERRVFNIPEQRNYDIAFAATDLTTQFDFDYATDLYQPFTGGPYVMPGMGTFLKMGMLDVFEDYKIEGGFRYSFNNRGTEFFVSLEDRSQRIDKKYIFQRQAITTLATLQRTQRTNLHQAKAIYRYAIDEVNAVQVTVTGRADRIITLGRDAATLEEADATDFYGGLKAEYIFDNTLAKSLNILNGTRLKVFAEHYRGILDPSDALYVTGLDLRNYLPIHRDLIWANRLAASSSFGPQKLVYYLGSVDNWVVLNNRDRFDFSNQISPNQGYQFQTIATNMRGFVQNARNGNNFIVFNSEVRWPIVRYFTNQPLKSEFFSTLQLISFFDLGTAWTGRTPYSDENTFNRIETTNGSVTVIYENQSGPFVAGTGLGVRAKLWGYFARLDYAWGIENGLLLPAMMHLSLGLDF